MINRLEKTILKNLIYNEDYTRKVLPFIKPEYFSDQTERTVFKEVFDFVNKYKNLPSHEALVINFTESKNLTEPQVRESINLLNEIHDNKNETVEIKWLTEHTEKFCQDKAIYNAIMESVTILDEKGGKNLKVKFHNYLRMHLVFLLIVMLAMIICRTLMIGMISIIK